MDRSRRLCFFLKLVNRTDMVDMSVCDHDLFQRQSVLGKVRDDGVGIVARIDHDGFARYFIAENRAVALKPADRESFDNHFTFLAFRTFRMPRTAVPRVLMSELPMVIS